MEEYKSLNTLKGVACITVILLHCSFPGFLGRFIGYFMRFPVPVFFMISGYFASNRSKQWYRDKAKYIFILISELLMGTVILTDDWLTSGVISIAEWIMQFEFIHHPIRTIFLGTIFNGTLWYLYAVLWVWVIFSAWGYDNRKKAAYFLIPLLLTIEVYGRLFWQSVYDINEVIYIFRSFILQGIPFIMIGGILKEHEDKICGIKKASLKFMAIIIIGFLMAFTEYVIYKTYLDVYLSTIMISIGLMCLAVVKREMYLSKIIHHIGKDLSTIIYCIHLPVIYIIDRSPLQKWGGYTLPVIAVIVIILISECFKRTRKYIFCTHLRER